MLKQYGMTQGDFDTALALQNGACAICKKPFLTGPRIDHDHTTGNVRGLLCDHHNKGLGFFQDNPAYLRAAADYIEKGQP